MKKQKIAYSLVRRLRPQARPYQVTDTDLAGFKVRVESSGAIAFYARWGRSGSKMLGHFPETTPDMARERAQKLLGSKAGKHKRRGGIPTLADYLDQDFYPWSELHHKGHAKLRRRLDALREEFGDKRLTGITSQAVERWRTKRQRGGTSQSTTDTDIAWLRAALNKAVAWDIVDENPMGKVRLQRPDNGRTRYLSPDEEGRLRVALLHSPGYLHAMVIVSLNTGLRFGELSTLTWDRVDLTGRMITVLEKSRRQNKRRHVPMNDEAHDILAGWQGDSGRRRGLVFPGPKGEPIASVKTSWGTLVRRVNDQIQRENATLASGAETIPAFEDFRWHDLRHHFASRLVQAGVDLYAVQRLLGHQSLTMVQRYAHLAPDHLADAVGRLVRGAS